MKAAIFSGVILAMVASIPGSAEEHDPASQSETIHLPESLEGVYGRNKVVCRQKRLSLEGKVAIRDDAVFIEGGKFEVNEELSRSNSSFEGTFLPPGGWGKPLRVSFALRHHGKLIVRIYEGQMDPAMVGYRRCKPVEA